MESRSRLFMDIAMEARHQSLLRAGQILSQTARDVGIPECADRLDQELHRRLTDSRLRVLVIGEINHGKSTLVNALIGKPLLPMGITPTTSAIVFVRPGSVERYEACFRNHTRKDLSAEEFRELANGHVHDPQLIRIEVASPLLETPSEIEILDTPGFNDLERWRIALSEGELPHADVLLLVLDATQALTASERDLVAQALHAAGGFGALGAPLWVALTRGDLLASEDDRELVRSRVRDRLASIGITPKVLEYCAGKQALKDPKQSMLPNSGLSLMRRALATLARDRQKHLPNRARGELLGYANYIRHINDVHTEALAMESDKLDRRIEALKSKGHESSRELAEVHARIDQEVQILVDKTRKELAQLADDAFEQLVPPIGALDLDQLTHYFPGAVRDLLLHACVKQSQGLRASLENLAEDVLQSTSGAVRRRVSDAQAILQVDMAPLFVPSTSLGIDLAGIALGITGTILMSVRHVPVGLAMTVAAPLAHVALREKTVRAARERVKHALRPAISDSLSNTERLWTQAIQAVAASLREAVAIGHHELTRELTQALTHARALQDSDELQQALRNAAARNTLLEQVETELTSQTPAS